MSDERDFIQSLESMAKREINREIADYHDKVSIGAPRYERDRKTGIKYIKHGLKIRPLPKNQGYTLQVSIALTEQQKSDIESALKRHNLEFLYGYHVASVRSDNIPNHEYLLIRS